MYNKWESCFVQIKFISSSVFIMNIALTQYNSHKNCDGIKIL